MHSPLNLFNEMFFSLTNLIEICNIFTFLFVNCEYSEFTE